MSRHSIADAVLALKTVRDGLSRTYYPTSEAISAGLRRVREQLEESSLMGTLRGAALDAELNAIGRQMQKAVLSASDSVYARLDDEASRLAVPLMAMAIPAPASAVAGPSELTAGGHLHDFPAPGEPDPGPGRRYEPKPLIMPDAISLGIARQSRLGNCYLLAAVNAVAHHAPDTLREMVRPDPDDENIVIVNVRAGTYRLSATLPVDNWNGQEANATSPDGSTLVAYLEKAAAAHLGSYGDLRGGSPVHALAWLGAGTYTCLNQYAVEYMTDEDIRHVASAPFGAAFTSHGTSLSHPAPLAEFDLAEGHAYTIQGMMPDGRVNLYNPWGELHPKPIPVDALSKLDIALCWASEELYDPRTPQQEGPFNAE